MKEEKERIIQEAIKYKTKVGRLEEGLSIKEEENEKTGKLAEQKIKDYLLTYT